VHQRLGEGTQVGGERPQKRLGIQDQLVDVAYAGGKGQTDAALAIGPDRSVTEIRRARALGIEAHVVQRGAAAAHVAHDAERGGELGVERRHEGPVQEVVLEVVVQHALLDRRDRPAVTVRIDQPRHQELGPIAEHPSTRVASAETAPLADFGDGVAAHDDRAIPEHAGCAASGVGENVPAAEDQLLQRSLRG
jgi:hypothetical protein